MLFHLSLHAEHISAFDAVEKYFDGFVKIAALRSIVFYQNRGGVSWRYGHFWPVHSGTPAGRAHIVNEQGLSAFVFQNKTMLGRATAGQQPKIVVFDTQPFSRPDSLTCEGRQPYQSGNKRYKESLLQECQGFTV